jgi:hypothetical protein
MKLVASWHRVGRIRENAQISPEAVPIGIADLADGVCPFRLHGKGQVHGEPLGQCRWECDFGRSTAPAAEPLNGFFVLNTRRASSGPTKQSCWSSRSPSAADNPPPTYSE